MPTTPPKYVLRHLAIHIYRRAVRSIFWLPEPPVFVASQPKTGSHLLNSLLSRLPKMVFSGVHLSQDDFVYVPTPEAIRRAKGRTETDWEGLSRALRKIRNGHFLTAHFPARTELTDLLAGLGFRTIYMVRDPRDTVVSHAFYVTRTETNYLNHRYSRVLESTGERIMASITGFPPDENGRGQQPLAPRLAGYMGWLDMPGTHVCRFESLVGEPGGGSKESQQREIEAIARHVRRELSREQQDKLTRKVWSPRSSTFRKGQIGDWRNHFTDQHKAAFKEQAGQYLIDLGYETSFDW